MDSKQFLVLLLILALVLTISYISYIKITEYKTEMQQEAYIIGFQNGQLVLIETIKQNSALPYLSNQTGNLTIEWESLNNICSGE